MEAHGPRRKLTTILCADCAGYSRMMRADEERTYRVLQECRVRIDGIIGAHEGRIFGSAGDSVVAEFPSPVEAVRAALEIQQTIQQFGLTLSEDHRMQFRIGINLGDVIIEGEDLIGDGVNIASRLEGLSEPGGICVSGNVHEQVKSKLAIDWEDLGEQTVKNIAEPIRVYRMQLGLRQAGRFAKTRFNSPSIIGIAQVGVVLLFCLGVFAAYVSWRSRAPIQCGHASIAVLPFANLSGDPAQDYFSDGTTEDVTAALGRFSDLSVIARSEVEKYKAQPLPLDELSRKLGVCYVLEGSLRKSGDQVLVTAQLIDALSGRLLWSVSHDGDLKDLFATKDQITQNVVGKLAIKLQDIERRRAHKKPTDSLDAYDYLLRGREEYAKGTRSANTNARKMFEQAIQLDPAYASAYAALGSTRLNAAVSGWTEFRDQALRDAETMGQKAIELDADNAEAHRLLARIYFNKVQFDLANAEYDRAIALNPNDAESYDARGEILLYTGHPKEALESFDIAKRLNPSAGDRLAPVGWAYYFLRRYEDAVTAFALDVRAYPDDQYGYSGLAAAYAQLGRSNEAAQAADDLKRVWPFFEIKRFVDQFQGDDHRALIVEGLRKAGLR